MDIKTSYIDDMWKIHYFLQKYIHGLFDEHKVEEVSYKRKLKAY
jgi:hypothetical protein